MTATWIRAIIGGALSYGAGLIITLSVVALVSTNTGAPTDDPHGYVLIGSMFSILVMVVPLAIGMILLVPAVRKLTDQPPSGTSSPR